MEVIWTSSAAEDFLRTETSRPAEFVAALDGALSLLKVFPEMGSRIRHSLNLRRLLVGRKRRYGVYYGHTSKRITVVAFVDLRQDSDSIEKIICKRQP